MQEESAKVVTLFGPERSGGPRLLISIEQCNGCGVLHGSEKREVSSMGFRETPNAG